METVTDFNFLGSQINVDGDCGHEIKRCLFLGRKAMTNLDSILKSRDVGQRTFADKGPSSQSYGFSSSHVWMWELDHKKAEHWRIDTFELWCWRRLLRVPWTAKRSNQSVLKEINPEYSLEGLILKLQHSGPLMKSEITGKDPDAGKDWGQEKVATEAASLTQQTWVSKLWETVKDREVWCATVHGNAKSQTWLSNWTNNNGEAT